MILRILRLCRNQTSSKPMSKYFQICDTTLLLEPCVHFFSSPIVLPCCGSFVSRRIVETTVFTPFQCRRYDWRGPRKYIIGVMPIGTTARLLSMLYQWVRPLARALIATQPLAPALLISITTVSALRFCALSSTADMHWTSSNNSKSVS